MELYDDRCLGFIHCKQKTQSTQCNSELIKKAKYVFENSEEDILGTTKGFFICSCGQTGYSNYITPCERTTNDLLVHYFEYHQDEIINNYPDEIRKLNEEYDKLKNG